jgi:hypothetical protein
MCSNRLLILQAVKLGSLLQEHKRISSTCYLYNLLFINLYIHLFLSFSQFNLIYQYINVMLCYVMLCYVISAGAAEKMRVRFYVHDIIYVHHIISILVCVQSGATCTIVYMHYIMSIVVCVLCIGSYHIYSGGSVQCSSVHVYVFIFARSESQSKQLTEEERLNIAHVCTYYTIIHNSLIH